MNSNFVDDRVIFKHVVLEGSPYEVGKLQGELIKKEIDFEKQLFHYSKSDIANNTSTDEAIKLFRKYAPEMYEELNGFADGLGVDYRTLIYYATTYNSGGRCSHLAVLPRATEDGHLYVGRNYEFDPNKSDLRLCTTRVDKKAAHLGFSELLFGRNDGINEHGLCITMSAAVPGQITNDKGLEFWAVVRMILDNCANVNEAIELIKDIPIASYVNFILADKSHNAALIEVAGKHKTYKKINQHSDKKYVCSANHFTIEEMLKYDKARFWDSVLRYTAIEQQLNDASPEIKKDTIRRILSDTIPFGACCHHYSQSFGTLWSMVFDVTDISAEICFGSPNVNSWHRFNLNTSNDVNDYKVMLPNQEVINIDFFNKRLPAGKNSF